MIKIITDENRLLLKYVYLFITLDDEEYYSAIYYTFKVGNKIIYRRRFVDLTTRIARKSRNSQFRQSTPYRYMQRDYFQDIRDEMEKGYHTYYQLDSIKDLKKIRMMTELSKWLNKWLT